MLSNVATGLIAAVLALMVIRGYFRILRAPSDVTVHLVRGAVIASIILVLRAIHWDVLPKDWRAPLWLANTVFNVFLIWALIEFLRARKLLIPEDQRDRYRWWSAWSYPIEKCVSYQFLRRKR